MSVHCRLIGRVATGVIVSLALATTNVHAQDDLKAARERAHSLDASGKTTEAQEEFKRAIKLAEATYGAQSERTAYVMGDLANFYSNHDRYAESAAIHERVLKILESRLGTDHGNVGVCVHNLAKVYYSQARYAEAEVLLLRSLKIAESAAGGDPLTIAECLTGLGNLYDQQGRLAEAQPMYQRCVNIRRARLGTNHLLYGQALHNLATLYKSQGLYADAEPLLKENLRIQESKLGANDLDVAISLGGLADLYLVQERFDEAEPLYRRSLKIRETALGPDHYKVAEDLNDLAVLNKWKGNLGEAETLYQRSLAIKEAQLGAEHPLVAATLHNLAALYSAQNRFADAEPLAERSLKIRLAKFGSDHPEVALNYVNLARIQLCQDKLVAGAALMDRARRGVRRHVTRVLPMLNEKQQRDFLWHQDAGVFSEALSIGVRGADQQEIVRQSAEWLLNGKGVGHAALAQRALLTRDIRDPRSTQGANQLLSVRRQLANLSMSAPDAGQESSRATLMEQLVRQETELTQQLAASTGWAPDANDWVELAELQKSLPSDSLLVEIARLDLADFHADSTAQRPTHYFAWIIPATAQGELSIIDLGLADEIDSLLSKVREQLQGAAAADGLLVTEGEAAATAALDKDFRALAEKIWQPLAPYLTKAKELILSPDGDLWLVPWGALPVGEPGTDEVLLEKLGIRYTISGREAIGRQGQTVQTNVPVILANPNFNESAGDKRASIQAIFKVAPAAADNGVRGLTTRSLLPKVGALPGTAIEAAAIQPHLERYVGDRKPTLYAERYALESVAKKLRHPQVAVFATHGFFLADQRANQSLWSSGGGETRSAPDVDAAGKPLENPFLRCGLLLAGCNNREAAVGDDDGILTGMEIVSIDLRGTELVVLSACETGVGQVNNGDGVAGLRQAFQLAGAQAVVSTLWQIPDRESAQLMVRFFDNLAAGESKADALRNAQLTMIHARRERNGAAHPFFWAAYTLTGK